MSSGSWLVTRAANVIVRAGPVRPQPGELIRAGTDPGHVHLFDAASGERIGDG